MESCQDFNLKLKKYNQKRGVSQFLQQLFSDTVIIRSTLAMRNRKEPKHKKKTQLIDPLAHFHPQWGFVKVFWKNYHTLNNDSKIRLISVARIDISFQKSKAIEKNSGTRYILKTMNERKAVNWCVGDKKSKCENINE